MWRYLSLETALREQKTGRYNIFYKVSWIAIAIALYLLCYQLFYCQIAGCEGGLGNYPSDISAHIKFGLDGTGYSTIDAIIAFLSRNFGNEPIAVLESLFVVLTWHFTARLFERISGVSSVLPLYVSLGLISLTNIPLPVYNTYYAERLISQPWHNITYTGMRLFAVLTVCYFIDFYKNYLSRILWKNYLLVTLFLFLSAGIKPNFFISFSAALFVVLLFGFIRDNRKAENFRKYLTAGSMVLPSCAVLFLQSRILYQFGTVSGDATSGITLIWFSAFFNNGAGIGILKIVMCLAFPIAVFIINKGGDKGFKYIGLFFLVSFVISNIFQETGPRANDGNFFWGVRCGGFFFSLFAISYFVKNWKEGIPRNKIGSAVYKTFGTMLCMAHIVFSLLYFDSLIRGGQYFI
jgi:hypothetical protein